MSNIFCKLHLTLSWTSSQNLCKFSKARLAWLKLVIISLFYSYYFGGCSSELAELVPRPYSRGRSARYSDRLHDFSVTIPRCNKDVYVRMQSKVVWHFEIHQNLCFWKNIIKHPKITRYHQNLDMLGNMLLTINTETFRAINN